MDEKRSSVWAHFELDAAKHKTKCRLCGILLSYSGSSTSSMRKHLSMKHKSLSFGATTGAAPCKTQMTLTHGMFGSLTKRPLNRNMYEFLTRKAMLMCVRDLRPLNIIKGDGFRDFCHALNPNYEPPHPKTLHNYLIKEYNDCKECLIRELKQVTGVSFTTDMWTSCATHGYITVTGHYLTETWNLKSCILATRRVEERHTGDNIAEIILNIQKEFEVPNVCGITTDNASNMTVAARVAGYPHNRCFAHTLQLAVSDGLKLEAIDNVIIHTRKLVAFFAKSLVATQELENIQTKLGKDVKHVVTDVPTRWNSIYYMFERLLQLHTYVVTVLHDEKFRKHRNLDLRENQWILMEQLVTVMKPLVSATEVLCSEEFPTAAGIYPLVFALITKHLIPDELDTRIIADLKTKISDGLRSRLLGDGFCLSPAMTATAIDPCFKHLRFLEDTQRSEVQNHIVSLMMELPGSETATDEQHTQAVNEERYAASSEKVKQEPALPSPRKKASFSENQRAMTFLFGDIIEIDDDTDAGPKSEMQEYHGFLSASNKLSNPQTEKSFTLSWWRENAHLFPRIAVLAKRYLSVPGTSVSSERAFSAAGLTITRQRASLHPKTVDAILFLNKNLRTALKQQPETVACTSTETSTTAEKAASKLSMNLPVTAIKTEMFHDTDNFHDTQRNDTPPLPTMGSFDDDDDNDYM